MISSKHVLITFTILSASIWFMLVSGVSGSDSNSDSDSGSDNQVSSDSDASSLTLIQKIAVCIDLITKYHEPTQEYCRLAAEESELAEESIAAEESIISFNLTNGKSLPANFYTMMKLQVVDKRVYTDSNKIAQLISIMRNHYRDFLNNQEETDILARDFCESKMSTDGSGFIARILNDLQ